MPTRLEEQLRTTLASIGDAVLSTDTQGHIVFANRVAQSVLRAGEDSLLGRPIRDVFQIINEFTRDRVECPVEHVLQDGKVVDLANHTILIAQDGSEIP